MHNSFSTRETITYSRVGVDMTATPYTLGNLVQDGLTELFHSYGIDSPYLMKNYGAAWVVVRTSTVYHRFPGYEEKVTVESFITDVRGATAMSNTVIRGEDGKVCAHAAVETCILTFPEMRPQRVKKLIEGKYETKACEDEPTFEHAFSGEGEKFGKIVADFSHLDCLRHVNNMEYVRMLATLYGSEELDAMEIRGLQVNYHGQAREGAVLEAYRTREEGVDRVMLKEGDRQVVSFILRYSRK